MNRNGKSLTERAGERVAAARPLVAEYALLRDICIEQLDIAKAAGAKVAGFACIFDRSKGAFAPEEGLTSCAEIEVDTFTPESCPLCAKGSQPVKPGSRSLK